MSARTRPPIVRCASKAFRSLSLAVEGRRLELESSLMANRERAPKSIPRMRNFKITIQYDGTEYHGWQIQPNGRTIQGEITRAVSLLEHRPVTIYGAGRTDAGVHAEGQVAN